MTMIDQPIEMTSVVKKRNFFIDLVIMGLVLVLTLLRDLGGIFVIEGGIMILSTIVMIAYLFGYWWINKPLVKSGRNIFFTIVYGIALGISCSSLLFHLLYFPGTGEMTFIACSVGITVVAIDAIVSAFTKTITININTIVRLVFFAMLIIPLAIVPKDTRVHFTYRNHRDFLKLYEAKKSTVPFPFIVKEYEETHEF